MRIRNKPWAKEELQMNEKVVLNPEEHKGKWNEYFKNDNPIHVELGCGKGNFITETAQKNKNINYIAIEKAESVIVMGVLKSKEIDASLVFIPGFVENLTDFFEAGEISRIYINFCDPWENRKKWEKRRLNHNGFLNTYKFLFKNIGEVFFKTDNKQLFEFSINEFANSNWHLKNITLDLHNSVYEGNIMTEYEKKFAEKGMPIYRCEASK